MHAGDLAALDERGSGGAGSGEERGLDAGDVAGDDDEEFARADAAGEEKLDRAAFSIRSSTTKPLATLESSMSPMELISGIAVFLWGAKPRTSN